MIQCSVKDGVCKWCGNHYASNRSLKVHRYRCKRQPNPHAVHDKPPLVQHRASIHEKPTKLKLTKKPEITRRSIGSTVEQKDNESDKPLLMLKTRPGLTRPAETTKSTNSIGTRAQSSVETHGSVEAHTHGSGGTTNSFDACSSVDTHNSVQHNTFINSDNCTVDNRVFNLQINYNVISDSPGRLELEEYIKNHPVECLAHYCTCDRCTTHNGLETSYTRLAHSANKFIQDVIENGGIGAIDKMPVAKIAGQNSVCDQQSTIASRIEMSVTERERKRNQHIMQQFCISKPSDIMSNLKLISDNIELLYHAIESHLKMGSACRHAFDRNVKRLKKIKSSERRVIHGTEIKPLDKDS